MALNTCVAAFSSRPRVGFVWLSATALRRAGAFHEPTIVPACCAPATPLLRPLPSPGARRGDEAVELPPHPPAGCIAHQQHGLEPPEVGVANGSLLLLEHGGVLPIERVGQDLRDLVSRLSWSNLFGHLDSVPCPIAQGNTGMCLRTEERASALQQAAATGSSPGQAPQLGQVVAVFELSGKCRRDSRRQQRRTTDRKI